MAKEPIKKMDVVKITEEIKKRAIDNAAQSLNTLASCAVGVLSLFGTITVALVGFGIQQEKLLYLLMACVTALFAYVFHGIIIKWCIPYIVQLLAVDDGKREDLIGLRNLAAYLFDIPDWVKTSEAAKKEIESGSLLLDPEKKEKNCNKIKSNSLINCDFVKSYIRSGATSKHLGVSWALTISIIALALFTVIAGVILGWAL